jgi:hypothetical protein
MHKDHRGVVVGVSEAVRDELTKLGEAAERSQEGQRALVLAAALDDRAGIQAGGLASTDRRLGELMAEIRAQHKKPEGKTTLELLRGGAGATG